MALLFHNCTRRRCPLRCGPLLLLHPTPVLTARPLHLDCVRSTLPDFLSFARFPDAFVAEFPLLLEAPSSTVFLKSLILLFSLFRFLCLFLSLFCCSSCLFRHCRSSLGALPVQLLFCITIFLLQSSSPVLFFGHLHLVPYY